MSPTELALAEPPPTVPLDRPSARADGVALERVLTTLRDHGFDLVANGAHVLGTRGTERVVVPAHHPVLPDAVARRLEWGLAPLLGREWLAATDRSTTSAGHRDTGGDATAPPPVVRLSAVAEATEPDGTWCSFLVEEPSVMGHGPSAEAALVDVRHAAAVWLGVPSWTVAVSDARRRP